MGEFSLEQEKKEIYSLSAEALAIQSVLVHVLRRLAKSDPNLLKAIAAGFDDAAHEVETHTIQSGGEVKFDRSHVAFGLQALRIIEICRKASLGAGLLADN